MLALILWWYVYIRQVILLCKEQVSMLLLEINNSIAKIAILLDDINILLLSWVVSVYPGITKKCKSDVNYLKQSNVLIIFRNQRSTGSGGYSIVGHALEMGSNFITLRSLAPLFSILLYLLFCHQLHSISMVSNISNSSNQQYVQVCRCSFTSQLSHSSL